MTAEMLAREATAVVPEPPDRALVALFDVEDVRMPVLFERHDGACDEPHDDHWYDSQAVPHTWAAVLDRAARSGHRLVRLYREDDPAIVVYGEVTL